MRRCVLLAATFIFFGLLVLGTSLTGWSSAQQAKTNHQEILDRISFWKGHENGKYVKNVNFDPETPQQVQLQPGPAGPSKEGTGKGYSIHLAVEQVNNAAYGSQVPALPAVRNDIRRMKEIATQQGFTVLNEFLNDRATRESLLAALTAAPQRVKSGDTLLVTYSGHGAFMPDTDGDEDDRQDETLCLYDGHLIDDELVAKWAGFEPGVLIVVILDSCHSSTATRNILPPMVNAFVREFQVNREQAVRDLSANVNVREAATQQGQVRERVFRSRGELVPPTITSRQLPVEATLISYAIREDEYDRRQAALRGLSDERAAGAVKAMVMTLAACEDRQTALDDGQFGFFTRAIDETWTATSNDPGTYQEFLGRAAARVRQRAQQNPTFVKFDKNNTSFDTLRAFSVKK